MNDKKIHNLCIKKITGEISVLEKIYLNRWLKKSSDNEKYFSNLINIWQKTAPEKIKNLPDINLKWLQLENSIDFSMKKDSQKSIFTSLNQLLYIPRIRYKTAAFAFSLAVCGLLMFFISKWIFFPSKICKLVTLNNQKIEMYMPDSSIVKLNSNSYIEFEKSFSGSIRKVNLSGEAFFKVKKIKKSPFIVMTKNSETTVLGTQFNICARDERTTIIVREGSVKFKSISDEIKHVILTKNQMSYVAGKSSPTIPEDVDTYKLLTWLDESKLVFEKTPLRKVLNELEKYYQVNIALADSMLGDQTITASFSNLKIEKALISICLTLDMQYKFESDKYILIKKSK